MACMPSSLNGILSRSRVLCRWWWWWQRSNNTTNTPRRTHPKCYWIVPLIRDRWRVICDERVASFVRIDLKMKMMSLFGCTQARHHRHRVHMRYQRWLTMWFVRLMRACVVYLCATSKALFILLFACIHRLFVCFGRLLFVWSSAIKRKQQQHQRKPGASVDQSVFSKCRSFMSMRATTRYIINGSHISVFAANALPSKSKAKRWQRYGGIAREGEMARGIMISCVNQWRRRPATHSAPLHNH